MAAYRWSFETACKVCPAEVRPSEVRVVKVHRAEFRPVRARLAEVWFEFWLVFAPQIPHLYAVT
jgi:hypothetical protein